MTHKGPLFGFWAITAGGTVLLWSGNRLWPILAAVIGLMVAAWRIYRPALWQLRHPRRAWWMAHTGRKLADAYETERKEEQRRVAREAAQVRAQRTAVYSELLGREVELPTPKAPVLWESGYDARGSWIRAGTIPFSADLFAPPAAPEPPWRVRIHVPAHDWAAFGRYNGMEGTLIDTQPMALGGAAYTVLVAPGMSVQIPVQYCVRMAKEAPHAP